MSDSSGIIGAQIGFLFLMVLLLFLQAVGLILAILSGLLPQTIPHYCWLISGLLLLTGICNFFIPTEDAKSQGIFTWSVLSAVISLICLTIYLLR